jgi:NAD(P)-dependent dehydrogenase (short-subunit alcohol dehydrogenase family)
MRVVYDDGMNTVLITGCSSGYGLETARYFLDREWNVIATMRTPREGVLPPSPRLRVLPLDVADPESIGRTVETAGPIDVLVNNAGVGLISAFESTSMDTVREIFETNTFGTMALVHAVLPQFRERKSGVIVNVSSTVTLRSLLLLSVYTASKAAINAFTESLALELEAFNIRVRLVLPGRSSETRFGENARPRMLNSTSEPYAALVQGLFARMGEPAPFTRLQDVAEGVWRAANDPSSPMRILAGADAVASASSTD